MKMLLQDLVVEAARMCPTVSGTPTFLLAGKLTHEAGSVAQKQNPGS